MTTVAGDNEITDEQARRLLFMVTWKGPWERVTDLIYGLRKDASVRWEVKEGTAVQRLADWAEDRDAAWRARYEVSGRKPHAVWRRRSA